MRARASAKIAARKAAAAGMSIGESLEVAPKRPGHEGLSR